VSIVWRRSAGLHRAVTVPTTEAEAARQEPVEGGVPAAGRPPGKGWRSHLGSLAFLAPGAVWLLVIVVYSMVVTVRDSLYDANSTNFVGLNNYKSVFSTADILVAFKNNVIWVVVFPFLVTFIGLVFAVLSERIRWSTAFKTIMFMPIVFSMTASAMVWRAAMDTSPNVGMLNATLITVSDWFNPPGAYPVPSGETVAQYAASSGVKSGPGDSLVSTATVSPGGSVKLGLIGFSVSSLQLLGAQTAIAPTTAGAGTVSGLVWRDFSPSHPGQKGQVFSDELGLPGMRLTLLSSNGSSVGSATSNAHGGFQFSNVPSGTYTVRIDSSNFNSGFTGISWLGGNETSVTPTRNLSQTAQALLAVPLVDFSMIVAYLWIWAGFAMVVLGAGLAALNREVLEAARIDGATEWQTLRRVTIPMLAPVLVVVFVTMIINVIKIFDIIITMPGSSQGDANTLATLVYNVGFGSAKDDGVASAIAVILFVLVIPAMLMNLRRIRG
jgi:alpha-glucoside transport system permease protein